MIADAPQGILLKLESDERLPDPGEDGGTIAQDIGLIALELIKREVKLITGKEFQEYTTQ
nr:MAG TPA: hypothetical protein [Caudoviricetes sp.]